jgi:hypothetical protein
MTGSTKLGLRRALPILAAHLTSAPNKSVLRSDNEKFRIDFRRRGAAKCQIGPVNEKFYDFQAEYGVRLPSPAQTLLRL